MKQLCISFVLAAAFLASGCASTGTFAVGSSSAAAERKLAESARLQIESKDPVLQATSARKLVQAEGGFVQHANVHEDSARLFLKVPVQRMSSTMDALAGLGKETSRSFHAEDITGAHQDLAASLTNKRAALKRLHALLPSVTDPKRVLEIERQMASLQTEIETLQASLAKRKTQVAYADLNLGIEKPVTPGPVTLAFKSVGWVMKKLFVLS